MAITFKSVSCSQCQSNHVVRSAASRSLVCTNCGAQIAVGTGEVLDDTKRALRTKTYLKLGLKGDFDGDAVEVVGWLLYRMKEDGEWYSWEEWLLVGTKNTYWISYDHYEEVYSFYQKITQPLNKNPATLYKGSTVTVDDVKYAVLERDQAKLAGIAGEIPWKARVGEEITYIDAQSGQKLLGVDLTPDELEVFVGREISGREILENFKLKQELAQFLHEERTRLHWRKMKAWIVGLMIFGFILAAVFFVSGKRKLYERSFSLCSNPTPSVVASSSGSQDCDSTLIGPFTFDQTSRIIQINLSASTVAEGNWPYVLVELQDKNGEPQTGFFGDFWRERWQEGGESGVESETSITQNYKLTQPGEFYLYVELDKDANYSTSRIDTFTVSIYDQIVLSRFFLIYSGILLVIIFFKNKWYEHFDD